MNAYRPGSERRTAPRVAVAAPLPECRDCELPTRRDVHRANAGRCSTCQAAHVTAQLTIDDTRDTPDGSPVLTVVR